MSCRSLLCRSHTCPHKWTARRSRYWRRPGSFQGRGRKTWGSQPLCPAGSTCYLPCTHKCNCCTYPHRVHPLAAVDRWECQRAADHSPPSPDGPQCRTLQRHAWCGNSLPRPTWGPSCSWPASSPGARCCYCCCCCRSPPPSPRGPCSCHRAHSPQKCPPHTHQTAPGSGTRSTPPHTCTPDSWAASRRLRTYTRPRSCWPLGCRRATVCQRGRPAGAPCWGRDTAPLGPGWVWQGWCWPRWGRSRAVRRCSLNDILKL